MNQYKAFFIALLFLLLPQGASAMQSTEWSFAGAQELEGFRKSGELEASLIPEGLLIQTNQAGQLLRETSFEYDIDVLEFTYVSPQDIDILLLWRTHSTAENIFVQLPLSLSASLSPNTIKLSMREFDGWDRSLSTIGFAFPEEIELLIQNMTFSGWSFVERIGIALQTTMRFDRMRSYSVNFLWGPLLTYDPYALQGLYWSNPPVADSANTVLYLVMGVALLICIIIYRVPALHARKNKGLFTFSLIVGVFWIAYDARMGIEFLSHLQKDIVEYHSQLPHDRTFRDRENLHTFAEEVSRLIGGASKFVFVAPGTWPYTSIMQYMTHPALPLSPNKIDGTEEFWVIYDRPDIVVNDANELVYEGESFTLPGNVLRRFDEGTYIFRINT